LPPHNRDHPSGGHFNGTYAPVGEPSTASRADDRLQIPASKLQANYETFRVSANITNQESVHAPRSEIEPITCHELLNKFVPVDEIIEAPNREKVIEICSRFDLEFKSV
jgi:hypothetical protein